MLRLVAPGHDLAVASQRAEGGSRGEDALDLTSGRGDLCSDRNGHLNDWVAARLLHFATSHCLWLLQLLETPGEKQK